MILMMIFMAAVFSMDPKGPPAGLLAFMFLFIGAIYAAMIAPSFVAGYGLLKGKRWAKTAAIVAGVLSASSVPFGTGVTVYTFWFLFSEPGKAFFEQQKYALPPRRQEWAAQANIQEQPTQVYVPPKTPPDWR
jgi:hypothetical protein